MIKNKDCFAAKDNRCVALTTSNCAGCAFYHNAKEMARRREKANERLRNLDQTAQKYIADKYYRGDVCW